MWQPGNTLRPCGQAPGQKSLKKGCKLRKYASLYVQHALGAAYQKRPGVATGEFMYGHPAQRYARRATADLLKGDLNIIPVFMLAQHPG